MMYQCVEKRCLLSLKHFCNIVYKPSPPFRNNFKSRSQPRSFVLFVKRGGKIADTQYIQYMYITSIWCMWEIMLRDSFSEKTAAFNTSASAKVSRTKSRNSVRSYIDIFYILIDIIQKSLDKPLPSFVCDKL